MHSSYTVPLDQIGQSRVELCGGKGASLGELVRVGVRVPDAFVVTRPAFDGFLQSADPDRQTAHWLSEIDAGRATVSDAASSIESLLDGASIPADIASEIEASFRKLGVESVSVRSSATCEDGSANAWAGQLDTFLEVTPGDVVARVKDCWLSIFRPPALAYGAAHGYGAGEFAVAVVVQTMISSEVSGIGFTVHPVTQEPDLRLIEACFGQASLNLSARLS